MSIPERPLGRQLGWTVRQSRLLFESRWFNLRQDLFSVAGGGDGTYTYVEHPGSVFVVPITAENRVLLIRSYRFPIDAWCWEVPAGSLGDAAGASPEAAALRELEEEIGATCRRLEKLGAFYLGNGFASLRAHFFLALDVERTASLGTEAFEHIAEVREFAVGDISTLVRDGVVEDGDSAFALLLASDRLRRG